MSERPGHRPTEETCGLDQSDGSEEGPLIDRQGVQAEELGDCLGARQSQSAGLEVLTAQSIAAISSEGLEERLDSTA